MTKKELYDLVFPKYIEWMRESYLENPNRKTVHPFEYVQKVIELILLEQKKEQKVQDRIY
jgi:hypothetical protein